MKTVITAKLKLYPTPEQFAALRTTQLAYRDALNFVSRYAFDHGNMSNKVQLQGEPSQPGTALCLSTVPLHPPCRSRGRSQYYDAHAARPARLDEHGALVNCP
jgi:hypothetical protein